jgi:peroxiredoxin
MSPSVAHACSALGIDEVIVFCVNDGAVMKAWAETQGISKAKGLITFMADPSGEVTKALGLQLTHAGPIGKGLIGRCKRSAIYLDDGEIMAKCIAEGEDDPAGDSTPSLPFASFAFNTTQQTLTPMRSLRRLSRGVLRPGHARLHQGPLGKVSRSGSRASAT